MYTLIDPPVNLFSTEKQIEEWIAELESMESNPQVKESLTDARELLETKQSLGDSI